MTEQVTEVKGAEHVRAIQRMKREMLGLASVYEYTFSTTDPERDKIQQAAKDFAQEVVTPGRISVIVDHITRDGNTKLDMSRTGDFIRAFVNDVMCECRDVYDVLEKKEINIFNKTLSSAAVPMWKEYLMK